MSDGLGVMWTPEKVRELRLRLGWSQAELARRLSCKQADVASWEAENVVLSGDITSLLDRILEEAQEFSLKMKLEPIAEAAMKSLKSCQIDSEHAADAALVESDKAKDTRQK